jgi:alpha-glucosidase
MPWSESAGAGFSSAAPWLPIPNCHRALAVSRQQTDPDSVLNGFRNFMQWRRSQDALRSGSIHFLDAPEPLLLFTRKSAQRTLLVAVNLGADAATIPIPAALALRQIQCPGPDNGAVDATSLRLPAHSVIYADATERAHA